MMAMTCGNSCRCTLPTGELTADAVVPDLGLRPGLYGVRITGWRQEPERYLAQFWLLSPTAGLVQSAGCQIREGYDRFGVVDAPAGVRELPPIGPDWLSAEESLVQISHGGGRPVFRLERWDGRQSPARDSSGSRSGCTCRRAGCRFFGRSPARPVSTRSGAACSHWPRSRPGTTT
jgi:hypothetical protein